MEKSCNKWCVVHSYDYLEGIFSNFCGKLGAIFCLLFPPHLKTLHSVLIFCILFTCPQLEKWCPVSGIKNKIAIFFRYLPGFEFLSTFALSYGGPGLSYNISTEFLEFKMWLVASDKSMLVWSCIISNSWKTGLKVRKLDACLEENEPAKLVVTVVVKIIPPPSDKKKWSNGGDVKWQRHAPVSARDYHVIST